MERDTMNNALDVGGKRKSITIPSYVFAAVANSYLEVAMRTKEHYFDMLSRNPNVSVGFTLAADMVYAVRHDVIHRPVVHQGNEWRSITRNLKSRYGETLMVDQVRHEMLSLGG